MPKIYWILLFLTISLIVGGIIITNCENNLLETCSKEGKAVVVKKYKMRKKGYSILYIYVVNQKEYKTSESIKRSEVKYINIGDTLRIKYSCQDPNVSRYIF